MVVRVRVICYMSNKVRMRFQQDTSTCVHETTNTGVNKSHGIVDHYTSTIAICRLIATQYLVVIVPFASKMLIYTRFIDF